MTLDRLKNFNADSLSLDEMVELSAVARVFEDEFERVGVEKPDWLPIQVKSLRRTIKARTQDTLEAKLAKVEAQIEAAKTPAEKREELTKQREALRQQLGVGA